MKVSTRGRYALKMLTDLAIHQGEGYINLKEISQRQGVSKNISNRSSQFLTEKKSCRLREGRRAATDWQKDPTNM